MDPDSADSQSDRVVRPPSVHWCRGVSCCDPLWEQAYQDFETPSEEVGKFLRRFRQLGLDRWPRDWRVVDLFCGRGNSLVALTRLGFGNLEGVDLSPELLAQYSGGAQTYVGDCRELRFAAGSKDAVTIQGGLHHLSELPRDLDAVLSEVQRILRPGGRLAFVEPWQTPFLSAVHAACAVGSLRRTAGKLDALARMIEQERETYERWLRRPGEILDRLSHYFVVRTQVIRWGKLMYVGESRALQEPGDRSDAGR